MKTKLISLLILLSLSATAQISILSSDMPVAGDTVRTSITSVIAGFDFEQTGTNHLWDYRGLQALSQRLDTFKTVSQTPVYFWPSFIISANLATRFTTAEILPDTLVTDAYSYFSNTAASFRDIGMGLMVMGLPIPLKFSTPDVVYSFPMTMSST
ncbi:MAG: hypothetical protein Q8T08_13330, partial [Ignavibacteria bacterium]|nr:hypothetical protein [Ignavibacteria bacterium]